MSFVTFSLDRQYSQLGLKPPSEEKKEEFRQIANTIAARVLRESPACNLGCNETLENLSFVPYVPKIRQKVSLIELVGLERGAISYDRDLNGCVQSIKGLITYVEQQLEEVDFSNGYEEETRNSADLTAMERLFRTYMTIQQFFAQKCYYLDEDRKPPAIKEALIAWFNAAMGNLSLNILREIALNNQDSRRGQLINLDQNEEAYRTLRDYILDRIGALDLEENPDGWVEAALLDLEKLLALPNGPKLLMLSPQQQQLVKILNQSIVLLKHFSH